jgi:RNA polymerase sigma-70 factor (ECF subfamily)
MATDELELIRQTQSGQTAAFGGLYESYVDRIYAFILYKTHHRETAQDITSRVFVKALENISDLKAENGAFQRWVYTIARNAVIDHYRTLKKTTDIEDVWDLSSDDDIARDAELKNELSRVSEYLKELDPVQRDVVMLRVWQDMPYAEIAAIVGKSPDNCKVIFSRAIRRLRADLAVLLAMALIRSYISI